MRVALVLAAISDLAGSGGTERQFSDLFHYLRRHGHDVELVTARAAVPHLQAAGRLPDAAGVIALPLGSQPARSKLGIAWLTVALLWTALRRRWDVVHICQPTPVYVPFAAVLSRLPRSMRPRIAVTVVDCTLAHNLDGESRPADLYERQVVDAHRLYFRWVRLDGVYSWYQAFVRAASSLRLLGNAIAVAAKYCFTDTARFAPAAKQRMLVFAGRFSTQKRPLLFVDAMASLRQRHPSLLEGWQIAMYGAGPLEEQVRTRIALHGLPIAVTRTLDMAPIFAQSRLFVSTQAYENFTSLAMLEAMSAGNAIIAERAGQSDEFVKDDVNGYLVASSTADAFADAIANYIANPGAHDRMAAESRRLAVEVHTIDHFAGDITAFWKKLLAS